MSALYLIVEDHPIVAEGIKQQIQSRGPGDVLITNSLAEAYEVLKQQIPPYMVVDLSLPDGDGIEFFRDVSSRHETVRGILLSGLLSDVDVQRALNSGFVGILTKSTSLDLVVEALAAIADGKTFYAPEVAPLVESLSGGDIFTPRMIEVLAMLQEGLSNSLIASALSVSEATVSFHVSQIRSRLGARTNRQILTQARKLGISLRAD
ncbi:MAG: DNA-binding NarL/FixJ family response regulator [Glaciecola sp.]|jgi:DNA-binding NarL/FixJ family response regulator